MLFQELNISIRSSNPVVPSGRRSKLCWTEEEEAALKVIILDCKFSLLNPHIISCAGCSLVRCAIIVDYLYFSLLLIQEAMAKFTPQDDTPIPWVQILEYGRDVFHRTRLPSDLRVKWRNMKKRAGY